ncbi:MAG: efflux RND transporter permease subunit [Gemmatimonadales bacterium]|nr:MAG: efflux RND transporter permease subunit [Gemmatimonadales bacterium]
MKSNVAGRLAAAFLDSKLTPLIMAAALGLGVWTLATMPSEEEPQILVPLADIYLPMSGATPEEVENRLLIPLESVVQGIDGVEYVYSHAEPGFGLATVRYEVGRDMEESLVQLYSTMMKHMDEMPPGFMYPLVKTVTIDDVPFFTATLRADEMSTDDLRVLADELRVQLEAVPNVREVQVVGGEPREIRVELLPERLAEFGLDPAWVAQRLQASNARTDAGEFTREGEVVKVTAGPFLATAEDVERVVLDVRDGALVQVGDVARVVDGPAEITQYTFHTDAATGWIPMVAVAVSKRPRTDATELGQALEERLHEAQGTLIPSDVTVAVARNYGETAREKVVTLQEHLLMAILAVGLVVALTMGWRAAVVVMMAVPVTFALTLFVYQIFGYTLNRVTLFALIFVTGIVIDDSIIVAENMERHFAMRDRPLRAAAKAAVDEVGNPTILATLTVIAAVLPMLFVGGLMGPYMSPMPIGATVAMLFSLGVALIITPWLAFKLLKGAHGESHEHGMDEKGYVLEDTKIYVLYRRFMEPLLDKPVRLWGSMGVVALLLLGAGFMFVNRTVAMKMLPFDDKNEIQVILDLPEGTPLETTLAVAQDVGRAATSLPEVADVQLYAGTAAPHNFNGMIRHYYLRRGSTVADLQVNLVEKGERSAQSHDVALALRPLAQAAADRWGVGAVVKVAEVPPGPPVLSTLVAEIYGPDDATRERVARAVVDRFAQHPSVVDIDVSLKDPQTELKYRVDQERAALAGVDNARVVQNLALSVAGQPATHLEAPGARTVVPVKVRLAEEARSGADRLDGLHVPSMQGAMVPLSEVVEVEETTVPQVIDRKNGERVVYVMAEVAGGEESPVYAILDMNDDLAELEAAGGELRQLYTSQPTSTREAVLKWDGEWQITFEVFRDLGIAFAGALVLIYVLIVAWFGSFSTPLVMMAAIPLTLVGIAPGHWMFGAFFTATSMIGMIALAGIMVRNGILLIDYLEARIGQGVPLKQAVIEAGAVRTRPIALTAGTVVIGAVVILFDPIFQGLAVALITGALASTVLTLIVVPGIYFLMRKGKAGDDTPPDTPVSQPTAHPSPTA